VLEFGKEEKNNGTIFLSKDNYEGNKSIWKR
jgi:hypothetical protein